jgi:hypothetical protein
MPGLTREQLIINIGLYGQQVIVRVRELLSWPPGYSSRSDRRRRDTDMS